MIEHKNILITSAGRRVSLIKAFRNASKELNIDAKIYTTDMKENAPAGQFSDRNFILPKVTDTEYLSRLLSLCKEHKIKVLIPTIDPELQILAKEKYLFSEIGTNVIISSEELCKITYDKFSTFSFFQRNLIDCAPILNIEDRDSFNFPVFMKPAKGSSSIGATKINSKKELEFFYTYLESPIIQEFIDGDEYTIDAYINNNGKIKTIVPRLRIETRAGEVSKGMTKRNSLIIEATKNLISKLPSPSGVITIQCFFTKENKVIFNEINPRFGGGAPLSIEAGANFPKWILSESFSIDIEDKYENWEENLTMLRYDSEYYVKNEN